MRVYLPATTTVLSTLVEEGKLPAPHTGFAVTPALRSFYAVSEAEAGQAAVRTSSATSCSMRSASTSPSPTPSRSALSPMNTQPS